MASLEHDTGAKAAGEEHVEYESDSEDGTSALALRRRVASDDEEDDEETNNERSDGYYAEVHEGRPPGEDEDDEEEDGEEEAEEEGEYEDAEYDSGLGDRRKDGNEDYDDGGEEGNGHSREDARKAQGGVGTTTGVSKEGVAEEKKDAEPFVVPTAGAFYMHDDRFRYNGIARPRRSAGGRKLWEAKDEKPWVHDRFEELKLNDESYPGQGARGRRGRGRQGRVQGRGKDATHARGRGHREKVFDDPLRSSRHGPGRGRGLRRAKMDDYEFRESRSAGQKALLSSSHETTGLPATATTPSAQKPAPSQPIIKPQEAPSKKPTISSMLNISSPPFFPTGTISQNMQGIMAGTSKSTEEKSAERDVPQVRRLVNTSRSGMEREMTGFSSASVTKLPSNLGINTSLAPVSNNGDVETGLHRNLARGSSTSQQQLSKTGSGSIAQQQRIVRAEVTTQHLIEQPLAPQPSSRGAPPATQSLRVQSLSVAPQQTGKGTSLATQSMRVQQPHQQLQAVNQGQISSAQPVQSPAVVSPVSFPAKPAADLKAAPPSLGSNLGSGAIGRGTQAATMPAGRGSLVYGSSSLTNGLRSVVQFAGQPQAGLGVPTVGVALPGYSNQPQFSFPNSEVTWIPILAGGGSLGSNYSSPYIAVDGGSSALYYTQQGSQASAFPPSGRDLNGSKTAPSNSFIPPSRTEPDDLGQQRRRYSQMTFGEERR